MMGTAKKFVALTGEKREAERKRKKISAAISHFKNRYFLDYFDYVTLEKDTNALANVISGHDTRFVLQHCE